MTKNKQGQLGDPVGQVDHSPARRRRGPRERWLVWGFASLGLCIGFLAGMSSAAITAILIGALFALIGGSVIAVLTKLHRDYWGMVGQMLIAFCVASTLATVLGIVIKDNRLLSFASLHASTGSPYLKTDAVKTVDVLEAMCRNGDFTSFRTSALEALK